MGAAHLTSAATLDTQLNLSVSSSGCSPGVNGGYLLSASNKIVHLTGYSDQAPHSIPAFTTNPSHPVSPASLGKAACPRPEDCPALTAPWICSHCRTLTFSRPGGHRPAEPELGSEQGRGGDVAPRRTAETRRGAGRPAGGRVRRAHSGCMLMSRAGSPAAAGALAAQEPRPGRGTRCHSGPRGARSSQQPRSRASQSPFQQRCGLRTGGVWSDIKAHYENYNISHRACPRRQLCTFEALSPVRRGRGGKISI